MRLLILGGTTEASTLARAVAGRQEIDPVLSLAGRTEHPARPAIPFRVGGFGGAAGLADYLRQERFEAVVDATHPFAAQISRNAVVACADVGVPLAVLTRPPWERQPGDQWRQVGSIVAAVEALGPDPRRVFLTTGRQDLAAFQAAPQHRYLIRTVDEPDLEALPPHHTIILDRGPFSVESEARLMAAERVDVLVSKNSGGTAVAAKLSAARALGLPVIMVERPERAARSATFTVVQSVLDWLGRL